MTSKEFALRYKASGRSIAHTIDEDYSFEVSEVFLPINDRKKFTLSIKHTGQAVNHFCFNTLQELRTELFYHLGQEAHNAMTAKEMVSLLAEKMAADHLVRIQPISKDEKELDSLFD